jgi:hypothetical protein
LLRYEIPILWYAAKAKFKALIPEHANLANDRFGRSKLDWIVIDAETDDQAYAAVIRRLTPKDQRPIGGRKYVKKWRLLPPIDSPQHIFLNGGLAPTNKLPKFQKGDRIILHFPYVDHRIGTVDEVLAGCYYGIKLDDYPNIADFHIRQFALFEERT